MKKSFEVNSRCTRLVIIVLVAAVYTSFGQDQATPAPLPTNAWNDGSILTSDGKELIGLVRYNGLLAFQNGDKNLALTAQNVVAFEFFDDQKQKQRLFFSFPYQDEDSVVRPQFFESLIELKSIALLSKSDPVDISRKLARTDNYWNGSRISDGYAEILVTLTFSETLYLRDSEGNVKPYARIDEKDIDGRVFDRKRTKCKVLDKDLLMNVLGKDNTNRLEKFAADNKLSFKDKNDLLQIFAYYKHHFE